MGSPAPTFHRLVLLLTLLASAPPATRARAPRPGPLFFRDHHHPTRDTSHPTPGISYHPTTPAPYPQDKLHTPVLQRQRISPQSSLSSSHGGWSTLEQPTRMGRERDASLLKNQALEDTTTVSGLYFHPVNRIPAPSLSRKPRRFRWTSSETKKKTLLARRLRTQHNNNNNNDNNNNKNDRPQKSRILNVLHYRTSQKDEGETRHDEKNNPGHFLQDNTHNPQQDSDSDLHLTFTVPSTLLQPLLTSLPLTQRHVKTSTTPEVEIVGLRIQDSDDTNTTVVLSLRDHRSNEQEDEEEQEETDQRPLSRAKRGARRRIRYGMNARIRAQMLAHRLSISYRHVQPCSYKDRYYCMNGGTCVFVGALDIKTCRCPIGYTGVRCELIDQEYILSLLTDSIIFS